jgi:hypothetical protein
VIKNIKTATEFIDDYGYDWICHTSPDRSQWYSDGNTVHYQIFDQVPEYVLDTAKENFSLFSTSIIKQNPGMILPEHTDSYFKFKNQHNVKVREKNWQPGHYFDVWGLPILQWKKGDYVELKEGVPHRGSNSGKVPKYTAQITGIKK